MTDLILYHGSPERSLPASLSHANLKGDFGTGFYLTADRTQAREWAVCNPAVSSGFVHGYVLSLEGLKVLDLTDPSLVPLI